MTPEQLRDSERSAALYKDLMGACAKHNLGSRDTIYTLCIALNTAAQGCGMDVKDLMPIMRMLRQHDLTPLLAFGIEPPPGMKH